jgi:hypothetical protein
VTRSFRSLFAFVSIVLLATQTSGAIATAAPASFTTFEVAQTPGITCPGNTACTNPAAEPQIRAAADGAFYASSENGLGGGTEAWKSTDGGLHYLALQSPNAISITGATGLAPGGGDTDLATAPIKNSTGNYNVYVASLSLANVDVSTSTDNGATWKLNPTGATIPGDDREWIAADTATKVCISYHDVATFNIDVNCSFDSATTFTQLGDAIDAQHAFLINNNAIGNLAIDPSSHVIYQLLSGIASATEVPGSQTGSIGNHAVWIGVSTDGGKTFTDHAVYINPNTAVSYGHQFVNISIDRAGTLYAVFTDNHNLFYSWSTDHGTTWSAPVQVNQAPSNTAIMPWSVAGDAGKLDVVWYGTSYFDGVNPPDSYPASASWFVYFAQNLHASTAGSSFSQTAATPVVHFGGTCESGVTCSGNRDLFDDFGVAANPLTGLASIIYSDDQFINDANDPAISGCTASTTNTSSCDHTAVATQTGGPGIFKR